MLIPFLAKYFVTILRATEQKLTQYFKAIYVVVLIAKSRPTLCNSMDCSPTGLLCPRDSPGKNAEVVAISFSRGSSQPGVEPMSPEFTGRFFTTEPTEKLKTTISQF